MPNNFRLEKNQSKMKTVIAFVIVFTISIVTAFSQDISGDWRIREFNMGDIQWYGLNIEQVTELSPVPNPDLSRVKKIGFSDLMPGGMSQACSRLDWIEVSARSVSR